MIKFYDQVPTIYSNASRDFQYLGWLINIVLNSVKHNVDDLYDLPNTKANLKLTELLAWTLGFKIKRNYDQKQLLTLVSIFPTLLKYKGTKKAIDMLGEALVASSGSTGSFACKKEENSNVLQIVIPEELIDITLFTDVLPYILPAGMTCHITKKTFLENIQTQEFEYNDELSAKLVADLSWDTENYDSTGLAGLFKVPNSSENSTNKEIPTFANLKQGNILNSGLMDNTVIPALDEPLKGDIAKKDKEN